MPDALSFDPMFPTDDDCPRFNVVIAYEDFETGKQAKQIYDFLVEHLGSGCPFANQMWKFDILNLPPLHEVAVRDARRADIVIVSTRSGRLPARVRAWLQAWLAAPCNTVALVGLCGGPREEAAQTREYLAGIARQGNLEFFAHPEAEPPMAADAEVSSPPGGLRVRRRNLRRVPRLHGFIEPRHGDASSSGWAFGV